MGGFDTMITERTKNILIESAWWDPVTVRRMSNATAFIPTPLIASNAAPI